MKHGVRLALAFTALPALLTAAALFAAAREAGAGSAVSTNLDVVHWQVVSRESGPVNYYRVLQDGSGSFVRAHYTPPLATTVLGIQIPDAKRRDARKLRWRWRAVTLPNGGDECASGKEDSAAVVYLTWKRTLKWYTLKYAWSAVGQRDAVCDRKRSAFVAQDTVILESGGPTGVWRSEEVDLKSAFRKHFDDDKADGDVPDFVGVGIMTDGDQTRSESSADYADFALDVDP
jgi:hypothetical protein